MPSIPLDTGPPSPNRLWGFAGGRDKQYTPQHIANTGYANMLRNGMFESFSQGAAVRPDAWATNGVGAFSRTTTRYWGQYGLAVAKSVEDGDVTRVEQSFDKAVTSAQAEEHIFTFTVWIKTDAGDDYVRPFFYDGTTRFYGEWYTGDDAWQELVFSFVPDVGASDLVVGIQMEETASGTENYYIDCAQLLWGSVAARFMEHPNDRSVICQHWEDQGTRTEVRGAMRAIPYEVTDTTSGGSTTETFGYTLQWGCRQICHVSANMYSYTGNSSRTKAITNNYSTTGFDIVLHGIAMTIEASKTFVITGVIWCIGWDSNLEQWK
jgi:hypothetical protein